MQGERARLRTERGEEYVTAKQGLQCLATAQLACFAGIARALSFSIQRA